MDKLSIIIPIYNEEENIANLLDRIIDYKEVICKESGLSGIEVIAVDDGSQDKTNEILGSYGSRIKIITHERNQGYGSALKTGFDSSSSNILSFLDADGTCNPQSFVTLYKHLITENADLAVGSRMDATKSEMPAVRWIGNKFFAYILSFFSGQKVTDSASGIRVFRKEILKKLYPLPDGLHFTPAMTAKALHEGFKIVEVPIPYAERGGKSKLSVFKDGFRFLKIIMDTVLMYNPFKVFLLLGLTSILFSALLLTAPIYNLLSVEKFVFSDYIYRSIGALYFFIVGIQIILFGILARFIVSTFFKRYESGKLIHKINDRLKVYDNMMYYGLVPVLLGFVINAVYAYKYFFGKGISLHWAYLLMAAGLIIIGFQMIITGVIMKVLRDINFHKLHQNSN